MENFILNRLAMQAFASPICTLLRLQCVTALSSPHNSIQTQVLTCNEQWSGAEELNTGSGCLSVWARPNQRGNQRENLVPIHAHAF